MKELLKLGVYTLLGTLLLSAPFAGLGMLSTHLVTEKTFWIQLIALFLSAVSLQGLWLNPSKGLCPWTYVDILPLSLLGLILLSYPYSIHPEPEKLLFIGQMVVLWYLLRQVFHEYPVLIGYFSMFFIATDRNAHHAILYQTLPRVTGRLHPDRTGILPKQPYKRAFGECGKSSELIQTKSGSDAGRCLPLFPF